jgi:hypothetical protein
MESELATFKERDRIVGLEEWQELERRFLAGEERKR